MQLSLSPTKSTVQATFGNFLASILPAGVQIIQGQDNRVAEPQGADFLVMTLMSWPRLATNIDQYLDATYTGSIAGTTLTVTAIDLPGPHLGVGTTIFGPSIAAGTRIVALGSGTGGIGTYQVSISQNVASGLIAAGIATLMMEGETTYQIDVHGPNSSDNANTIVTTFRDDFGVEYFIATGLPITPLYADDPKQLPFWNDQKQIETRWVVEAHLQVNQTITVPQQFADQLSVTTIEANAPISP